MVKKSSKRGKQPNASVTLKLTLDDLKKITDAGSSFGGDTWQQIHWGKPVMFDIEPLEARETAAAKKSKAVGAKAPSAAKKTTAKKSARKTIKKKSA